MENAVDSIVVLSDKVVARNVKDDQALKLFQVNNFFDFIDKIVAKVKLHECL